MRLSALLTAGLMAFATVHAAPAFPVQAANPAFNLKNNAVTAAPTYGSARAPAGAQFVILNVEWENRIDPKLATERGLATTYLIEDLAKHLYLVMDGQWLGVLRGKLPGPAQKLSLDSLLLSKPGAKVAGDLSRSFDGNKHHGECAGTLEPRRVDRRRRRASGR